VIGERGRRSRRLGKRAKSRDLASNHRWSDAKLRCRVAATCASMSFDSPARRSHPNHPSRVATVHRFTFGANRPDFVEQRGENDAFTPRSRHNPRRRARFARDSASRECCVGATTRRFRSTTVASAQHSSRAGGEARPGPENDGAGREWTDCRRDGARGSHACDKRTDYPSSQHRSSCQRI
jgi:hypothetical protein